MEGLYFYWLAWMAWIWATFFMDKKNPARMKLAFWLLAVIVAAPYKIHLFMIDLHLSAISIAMFLFIETRKKKTRSFLYLYLSSFIIMLAYTSFLLFELYDPVWVLFDRKIMISAIGIYLALLLQKNKYNRGLALISGFLQGEILYSMLLWQFNFPYSISSLAFMDILIISLAMLITWSAIETAISIMSRSTLNQAEREEQKLHE